MIELFGSTRNVVKGRYALLTPNGFVPSFLPGWDKAVSVVLISPAMGAGFCQLLVTLGRDGEGRGNTGLFEFFIYVVEGTGAVTFEEKKQRLEAGSFAYIPAGKDLFFQGLGTGMKLVIFQKKYQPLAGTPRPDALFSHKRDVKGQPFMGNADARLQVLMPDTPGYDMAVNIFTYQPGATLPFVETHIMEHGLLMLEGQGVYRLESDYHPVQAGDVIWMAPYCPQWFVAMGKTPASYIYYKDINRDPI